MSGTDERTIVRTEQNEVQETAYEFDLMEFIYRLLAHWKMIICFALAGFLIALYYTIYMVTPMYKATATIYVLNNSDSVVNLADLQIGTNLTQDYIQVFSMWEVHEKVMQNLGINKSYSYMKSIVKVTNTSNTRMLNISVTVADPKLAAELANEYAKVGSNYIAETMQMVKPSMMSTALEPTSPVSPNKRRNAVVGFMLGAVVAAGIVFIQMLLDDNVKTAEDIRKFIGIETLAVIPVEENMAENNKARKKRARGKKG